MASPKRIAKKNFDGGSSEKTEEGKRDISGGKDLALDKQIVRGGQGERSQGGEK